MDRVQTGEFLMSILVRKADRAPYCFEKCITQEEVKNELSREQERCLGSGRLMQGIAPKSIGRP